MKARTRISTATKIRYWAVASMWEWTWPSSWRTQRSTVLNLHPQLTTPLHLSVVHAFKLCCKVFDNIILSKHESCLHAQFHYHSNILWYSEIHSWLSWKRHLSTTTNQHRTQHTHCLSAKDIVVKNPLKLLACQAGGMVNNTSMFHLDQYFKLSHKILLPFNFPQFYEPVPIAAQCKPHPHCNHCHTQISTSNHLSYKSKRK